MHQFSFRWFRDYATGIDGGNYGRNEGIAFIGNHGTLVVNRGGSELLRETAKVDGQRLPSPPHPCDNARGENAHCPRS